MISFFPCSTVLFADPTDEEENLVTGIVTVVVTDDDKIAAVHKPGNMCFGDLTILGQEKKKLLPFDTVQLQQQQQQPFCKLNLYSEAVSFIEEMVVRGKFFIMLFFFFFFLQGGSPLVDDKLQECFKVAVKRAKEVRDLVQTACINVDR